MTEEQAKELKRKLYSEADIKGYSGTRRDAYVFGGMRRAGWKPKREKRENK